MVRIWFLVLKKEFHFIFDGLKENEEIVDSFDTKIMKKFYYVQAMATASLSILTI